MSEAICLKIIGGGCGAHSKTPPSGMRTALIGGYGRLGVAASCGMRASFRVLEKQNPKAEREHSDRRGNNGGD